MPTYIFELTLSTSTPRIWRKLSVPGRFTLGDLHQMLQIVFGWEERHRHEFRLGGERYTDPRALDYDDDPELFTHDVALEKALKGHNGFRYLYDFGDEWDVVGTILETLDIERVSPECLDGALAGPPEDCGGIDRYETMRDALKNPRHPDYEEMSEWAPPGFDPDFFDKDGLTSRLTKTFKPKASSKSKKSSTSKKKKS